MPKITRTLTRDMPNGDRYVAHIELLAAEGSRFDESGISPGFSLTGEIYEKRSNASGAARQRMGREPDISGAIGDRLVRVFPELALLNSAHLSDPDGMPMHAEANGWYWYNGSRDDIEQDRYNGFNGDIYPHQLERYGLPDTEMGKREYCYRVTCDTLRVDSIPRKITTREQFAEFVNAQQERWTQEAAEVRALIESLPEEVLA